MEWILLAVLAALILKLWLMRRTAREIARNLKRHQGLETNTLLDVSTRDKAMRELVSQLNQELRLLREARLQYQQGDQELKDAVTGISHDLRTPLTAIRGYLELLEREADPELVRKYLGLITGRVEAMSRLTEELFRYSVVAAEPVSLTPVDLGRALEESLVSFYGALQNRGITPEINLPGTPVPRRLDPEALSRILSNILSNALKYSAGDLKVALTPEGRATFQNTAPGLTPVTAARLFDRFYTIETGRASTGLGLSIAKLLTERMGGTITAQCHEGALIIELIFPGS